MTTVLLTDRAWPDDTVEREVLAAAGLRLVTGPAAPADTATIDALVAQHQPAAILTCLAKVSATAIEHSAALQVIARMGVGLDNIDVAHADYCVEEVSDHAVGLVLAWTRGLVAANREVRAGRWDPASAQLRRLSNLTCGVIGYGRIGRRTAEKLRALGTKVVTSRPSPLDELLTTSDVVILHAPLTEATRHLIGAREFALMPPGSLLVNVSRGGLVDTDALAASLHAGHLGGAGLDVIESEPAVPARLLAHPAVVITPHIAFSSDASLVELRRSAAEEVVRVLRGEAPRCPCNRPYTNRIGVS